MKLLIVEPSPLPTLIQRQRTVDRNPVYLAQMGSLANCPSEGDVIALMGYLGYYYYYYYYYYCRYFSTAWLAIAWEALLRN